MSKKYPLFVALLILLFSGSVAFASPGEERAVRSVRVPEDHGTLAKVWIQNLGDEPARIAVGEADEVELASGELAEAPVAAGLRGSRLLSSEDLLVIRGDEQFDPAALEVETRPMFRLERRGGRLKARYIPAEWVANLRSAFGSPLTAGQTGEASLAPGAGAEIAVALLEAGSMVEVELRDARGEVQRAFAATATEPTNLRVDLGALGPLADNAQIGVRVLSGKAAATVSNGKGGTQPVFSAASVGYAWFNQTVNYSGVLYYYVSGGPANTCGELNTFRNGSWLYASGWLCTDGSGNATKGPWYWADFSSQTDEPAYIRWPDNTTTNNQTHVWDKQCAEAFRDSPAGDPPTSYYGHATDLTWDAGFDFGTNAFSIFQDTSTGYYWDPATGGYTSSNAKFVPATLTRANRWYVSWSTSFPAAGLHDSTHSYYWFTCVDDGNCGNCASTSF